jgi:hypothetical protein
MSVHVSSKPADEASRLPAAAWLILGIVLVADIIDLLDSTITTIAAPAISSSLPGGPGLIKGLGASSASPASPQPRWPGIRPRSSWPG